MLAEHSLNIRLTPWSKHPSWETNSLSDIQEILLLLRNPQVHCRVYRTPPLEPIQSQMNPVHIIIICFFEAYFNVIPHIRLRFQSSHFPSSFPIKIVYAFLVSLMRATCPTDLILDFTTLTFGADYKVWSYCCVIFSIPLLLPLS
jgi:hypothetical protein